MNVLFIGGPMDGLWEDMDSHYSVYQVPERPAGGLWAGRYESIPVERPIGSNIRVHYYYSDILRMNNGKLHVYRHESISPEDIVKALIQGYRVPARRDIETRY